MRRLMNYFLSKVPTTKNDTLLYKMNLPALGLFLMAVGAVMSGVLGLIIVALGLTLWEVGQWMEVE